MPNHALQSTTALFLIVGVRKTVSIRGPVPQLAPAIPVTPSIPTAKHALLLTIVYQPMGVVSKYAHRLGLLLARVHAILDTHHRVPLALLSTTVFRLTADVR